MIFFVLNISRELPSSHLHIYTHTMGFMGVRDRFPTDTVTRLDCGIEPHDKDSFRLLSKITAADLMRAIGVLHETSTIGLPV